MQPQPWEESATLTSHKYNYYDALTVSILISYVIIETLRLYVMSASFLHS